MSSPVRRLVLPAFAGLLVACHKDTTQPIVVTLPSINHVAIVMLENHDYSSVIGSSGMPYLNGLARQGALATQYYADTHPSIGNYMMLATGDTVTNNDSWTGSFGGDNVIARLVAAGRTWKSYAEALPSVGYLTIVDNGSYASRHNPFVYLDNVRGSAAQAANIVPLTALTADMTAGTLPNYLFIVPNTCNDGHDCGLDVVDGWLKTNLDPLLQNAEFQQHGLLLVLFDESASDNTHGGGRIAWIAVGPTVKQGYQSTTLYQHESTLRLSLKVLGVTSYPGKAATAADMDEFFVSGGAPQ